MQQAGEVDHGWAFELDERARKAERSWGNGCGCTWGRTVGVRQKGGRRGKKGRREDRKWESCSASSRGGEIRFVRKGLQNFFFFFLSVVRFTLRREESCGVEDFTEASASHKMPTVCQQNNSVTFNIVMRRDASKTPAPPRSSSGYND